MNSSLAVNVNCNRQPSSVKSVNPPSTKPNPRRVSSDNEVDEQVKCVGFAPVAQLRLYPRDEDGERQKANSLSEYKMFHTQTKLEALRIKTLIQISPCKGDQAIKFLLSHNILSVADLTGIDKFIWSKTVSEKRRKHSAFVLNAQYKLQKKKGLNIAQKIAKAAIAKRVNILEKSKFGTAKAA